MVKLVNKGFTLIEVLIALVILAIALTAVVTATTRSIANTQAVVDRTIAHWVGLNILADVKTGLIALPEQGNPLSGTTLMLNQNWYWTLTVAPSNNPDILTVTVDTSNHANATRYFSHLIDFMRAPS